MDKSDEKLERPTKLNSWDDFFDSEENITPDFMAERIDPPAQERECLDISFGWVAY